MQETSRSTKQLRELRKIMGRNIRRHRTNKDITLRKLGLQTRISVNDLDLFELGRGKLGIENLAKIAGILDVELREFLRD